MNVFCAVLTQCWLLVLTFTSPSKEVDWKSFEDPQSFVLTDPVAKLIDALPAAEKEASIERLHATLKSTRVEIRRRAALTLGSLGDKSGVPIMIDDFVTSTGNDRDNVIVALRILKDERAIPTLRKALKDKVAYIRCIALGALGELKATEAYEEIVAMTRDKGDPPVKAQDRKLNCTPMVPAHMACYALGAIGEKRAIPVLIELLDDKDLRVPAVQALEILTQKKRGPDPEKWKDWWKNQQ